MLAYRSLDSHFGAFGLFLDADRMRKEEPELFEKGFPRVIRFVRSSLYDPEERALMTVRLDGERLPIETLYRRFWPEAGPSA